MTNRPLDKIKKSKEYARTDIVGGGKQNIENIKLKTYDTWYPKNLLTFSAANSSNNKFHPTQKPVELLEYLIKTYTNEGDLVLDNCSGSGSTLVAAKNLNRQFIGIEKEEEYYNTCLERLKC
jgi:site-specific DNA-methyltransferase (adenine-specific)